jgi:hypothetical protein
MRLLCTHAFIEFLFLRVRAACLVQLCFLMTMEDEMPLKALVSAFSFYLCHALNNFMHLHDRWEKRSTSPWRWTYGAASRPARQEPLGLFGQLTMLKKLKLKLRTDGQSVSHDQIFFLYWQLRASWCGASSLTSGWVCNLLMHLLQALAEQSHLGPSPRTHDDILLFHFRLPKPGGLLCPPGTGWPSYTPGRWVPFSRFLRFTGLRWKYCNLPLLGQLTIRSRSYFTTDGHSVWVGIEHPCGTWDQILLPVGMF